MSGNVITVDFRNDTIFAVERDDGVFVAVKPISDRLGLAWTRQLNRLKRDPILSEGVTMMVIPSPGGAQETTCLRLDLVNGWLFTIDSSRVKDDDVRQRVLVYQRECYRVLFEHFYGKREPPIEVEPQGSDAERVRKVTEARHTFGVRAAGELWFQLGLPITPSMVIDPRQLNFIDYNAIKTADEAG